MDASFPVATLKWPELPRGPNYPALPYHLDLTEIDTGACDHGYPSDALFEFGGGGGGGKLDRTLLVKAHMHAALHGLP